MMILLLDDSAGGKFVATRGFSHGIMDFCWRQLWGDGDEEVASLW
jgi:hypothetical protein